MDFSAYHDSHDLFYRKPFGAVRCGEELTFRLELCSTTPLEIGLLRLWVDGQEVLLLLQKAQLLQNADSKPQTHAASKPFPEAQVLYTNGNQQLFCRTPKTVWEAHYTVPDHPGLIWYYFILRFQARTYYYGNNNLRLGGRGEVWEHEPPAFQITVYSPTKVAEWYKKGVMYQIYVDRFFNGNEKGLVLYPKKRSLIHSDWFDNPFYIKDCKGRVTHWNFFGGNLKGIRDKLPYLKALGISILYLNPIFESPSNHKYDTGDYLTIDPMYGGEQDFEDLVQEAMKAGISILLDGVFSHTGSDSLYFNRYGNYPSVGAYQSPNSLYYSWFKFNHYPENYKCWWGVDDLPEINEQDPSYQAFIYGEEKSVLHKWMKKGIKGWRLDVADELPDEFIREFRKAMKRLDPDSVLIGEVWEDATTKMSYGKLREYFWGYELDATMNYPFRDTFLRFILGKIDAESLHLNIMNLYENYPRENFYAAMNLLGSHDRARILTLLSEAPPEESLSESEREAFRLPAEAKARGLERLKLLSLVQFTFPGVPCIYYGDEAGLEGYSDPYNRGTYPWGKENRELLYWFQKLIRLRQEYEVFQTGDFISFWAGTEVYGFKRTGPEEDMIILINRHPTLPQEIALDLPFSLTLDLISGEVLDPGTGITSLSDNSELHSHNLLTIKLAPLQGRAILVLKENSTPGLKRKLHRSAGVLLSISSLPSFWGIGDLGKEAFDFVDFLEASGQSLWQVLPVNPPDAWYSPYQSESAFAGNPLYICIEHLVEEGLLTEVEVEKAREAAEIEKAQNVELTSHPFAEVQRLKEDLFRLAFKRFKSILGEQTASSSFHLLQSSNYRSKAHYYSFLKENQDWLEDYALFRALKAEHNERSWIEWEPALARHESKTLREYSQRLAEEMEYTRFVQYTFYTEWQELKRYAAEKGIQIVGDLPFFVSGDSCDTWANPELFALDEQGRPTQVAGVPPDYFSPTGQLWGNPVYNWQKLAQSDYDWWKKRIQHALRLFDWIRLDHFRGFEAYWEVAAPEKTAMNGNWIKGPGVRFFRSLKQAFGELPFIAEDLGVITPEVKLLKTICGFPGMKVLQFEEEIGQPPKASELFEAQEPAELQAFPVLHDGDAAQYEELVYYTGTHDNDTLIGWIKSRIGKKFCNDMEVSRRCKNYIEKLYSSQASWVILPMQDILELDTEARMNVPGTIEGNWKWQMTKDSLTPERIDWLKKRVYNSGRNSK